MLPKYTKDLVVEPRLMSKLHGRGKVARQEAEKASQARDVFAKKGRQLKKHRATFSAEGRHGLHEIGDILVDVLEAFIVSDPPRRLEHKCEFIGNLLGPAQ